MVPLGGILLLGVRVGGTNVLGVIDDRFAFASYFFLPFNIWSSVFGAVFGELTCLVSSLAAL